ncbi:MAG: hypothetical protein GQ527_11480 [Bacteroidales bacterium]|nr:hypothetical protein [Bacteroidales bacterium]
MKQYKYQFVILIITFVFAPNINAQNIKIIVNPFHVPHNIPRLVGIQLENKLNVGSSLGAGISYYYMEPSHSGDGEYSGFRARLDYRKYIKNSVAYKGVYISPSLNYLRTSVPDGDEPFVSLQKGIRSGFGLGLNIGFQLIAGENILIGFALGPVYYSTLTKKEYVDSSTYQYWDNDLEFDISLSIGLLIR